MPAFLETDRLVLRGFTDADAGHLYELNSDHDATFARWHAGTQGGARGNQANASVAS